MNYSEYIKLKKRTGDINPFFSKFDSSKHKISKFKLILIMPDGECLFMPYSDNDKRNRIQEMYYFESNFDKKRIMLEYYEQQKSSEENKNKIRKIKE